LELTGVRSAVMTMPTGVIGAIHITERVERIVMVKGGLMELIVILISLTLSFMVRIRINYTLV
jgi:hypothetical protein